MKLAALAALVACPTPPQQAPAAVDAGVPRAAPPPLSPQTRYLRETNPRTLDADWTPDGEHLLVINWDACTVDAIPAADVQKTIPLGRICSELDAGTRGEHSMGERFVFWRGENDPVTVLSLREPAVTFAWPKDHGELLAASHDGARVAARRKNGQVDLIALLDGGVVASRRVVDDHVRMRFSPDGKTVTLEPYQRIELLALPSLKTRARVPGKWLYGHWLADGRLWVSETDGVQMFFAEVDVATGNIARQLTVRAPAFVGRTGELVHELGEDGGIVSRLVDGGTPVELPAADRYFVTSAREGVQIRAASDWSVQRVLPAFDLEPLQFDWKNLEGQYSMGPQGHLGGPYCGAVRAQLTLRDGGVDGRVEFHAARVENGDFEHAWKGARVISDGGTFAELSGPGWSLVFEMTQGPVPRLNQVRVDGAPAPCNGHRLDRD